MNRVAVPEFVGRVTMRAASQAGPAVAHPYPFPSMHPRLEYADCTAPAHGVAVMLVNESLNLNLSSFFRAAGLSHR